MFGSCFSPMPCSSAAARGASFPAAAQPLYDMLDDKQRPLMVSKALMTVCFDVQHVLMHAGAHPSDCKCSKVCHDTCASHS